MARVEEPRAVGDAIADGLPARPRLHADGLSAHSGHVPRIDLNGRFTQQRAEHQSGKLRSQIGGRYHDAGGQLLARYLHPHFRLARRARAMISAPTPIALAMISVII